MLESNKSWVHRHTANARICHWIMAISFFYLLYSGIMIFLHFPELYWGKVGFQGYPAIFKLEEWGISWERAEELGDRRWGRNYHYTFAWVFVINGLIYLFWNGWQKKFYRKMLPTSQELSIPHLKSEAKRHMKFRAPKGSAAAKYNVLQKLTYIIVLFILFPFMIISGFAQMPAFTAISPELIDFFGGRQTARTLHVVCSLLLVLFVVVHLVQMFVTGTLNQLHGMIIGKYQITQESNEVAQ
ncbi:MAG: cytochrome b/b6 domain-containing protein [Pseudomonadota bacterium]|nr:cytochrome b/b6 domain-containing protein [Pseudomonadota bacterium]